MKESDLIRILFENFNSLGVFTGDSKISAVDKLCRGFKTDILAGCEVQCDWRFVEDEDRKFHNLFGAGMDTKSVVGYNTTEKTVRDQKGGTAMMAFDRFAAEVM